jgi:hypothetical protein
MAEARAGIAKCKATLHSWDVAVDDLPDDDELLSIPPAAIPSGSSDTERARPIFNFYGPINGSTTTFGGEQQIREVQVTMGDNINVSNVSGSILNIKATLRDVTQRIDGIPSADQATKDELKRLMAELSESLQQAPTGKAEEATKVAKRAEAAVEEVSKSQPDKELITFNVESLKKAAANIAGALPAVLPIATKIAEHILSLAG